MNKTKIVRNVLIDEPAGEDSFRGGGHERVAAALSSAIVSFHDDDRAIGLDGPWGSGKSTVVEIAKRDLWATKPRGGVDFHFFTYDIWKSQGSAFRRSFLEHFLLWAKETFPKKSSKLKAVENKVKGKVKLVTSNNQNILDWYGIVFLLFIPFAPLLYFWAKSDFDAAERSANISSFLSSYPFLIIVGFVLATLAWSLWKFTKAANDDHGVSFKRAISQTLLLSAKHFENQKVTQHIREVDPNDFEFQQILREILAVVQSKTQRVVVVLDNIDRLPNDEIADHWALVRAVFSRGVVPSNDGKQDVVTAIVPYDRSLIETAVENDLEIDTSKSDISQIGRREIFSKTFDEVLFVSPPVMSNARDFFRQKLSDALPDVNESDALYRVYSIFSDISRSTKGQATPRQIVAFINELSGLYTLHSGTFALPSVAAFIAYQDDLSQDPSKLSSGLVSARIRSIAGDPDLDRNLAAMAFNVDPDLAFQILLDGRIEEASLSESPDDLRELSKSPGFDLRIHDIILENINDWVVSDDLGAIINNFVQVLGDFQGDSKAHIVRTLSKGISNADGLSLSENTIEPYLGILALADVAERTPLIEALISGALSHSQARASEPYARGRQFVATLSKIERKLGDEVGSRSVRELQKEIRIPPQPLFVLGMAAACESSDLQFKNFTIDTLDLPEIANVDEENPHPFVQAAFSRPDNALNAFQSLRHSNLLPPEHIAFIAEQIHESFVERGESAEKFEARLIIFVELYLWLTDEAKSEIELSEVFDSEHFFENLRESHDNGAENDLAYAIFLSRLYKLEEEIDEPIVIQPNGQRIRSSTEAFEWFTAYREGNETLEKEEHVVIADLVKRSRNFTKWLQISAGEVENSAMVGSVEAGLNGGPVPYISLATFLKNFRFIHEKTEVDTAGFMSKFESRIQPSDLEKLKITQVPPELIGLASGIRGWEEFLSRICELLRAVELSEWESHFSDANVWFANLTQAIDHLQFEFQGEEQRRLIVDLVVNTLSGRIELSTKGVNYDSLLSGVPTSFRGEVFRQIREEMHDVTTSNLATLGSNFPSALSGVISHGSRITKAEKDAIVRHIFAIGLEGKNQLVLKEVVRLGYSRVSDYVKNSEESTQSKLDGAWKLFSDRSTDQGLVRDVGEAIYGKRKAKSFFEILWGNLGD